METDFANIEGIFRTNTDIVTRAIADVADGDRFRKPGADSNHLTWVMGHSSRFMDAYHAGQVSYLRKWLGYGQALG